MAMAPQKDRMGIFLPFRAQDEFDFFLDDEDEDDSFAGKPGRMSNRLNAVAWRLPTTEELDEDQDNDSDDGEGGGADEHEVPNANVVGSGRRESLAVSRPMLPRSLGS